jgi:uncharacterized protein (DUF2252 family)
MTESPSGDPVPAPSSQPSDLPADFDVAGFFTQARPSRDERRRAGKDLRSSIPLEAHADAQMGAARTIDPIGILRGQESVREPALVPLRYERMSANPFAFLRGAAAVMAADLAPTPRTDITVQLCGDMHVSNFGLFATADRAQVFDVNDFDETLPGPFEWDVKRLAASAAVAARANGFKDRHARRIAVAAVAGYRTTMRRLSTMTTKEVWYARLDLDTLVQVLRKSSLAKATRKEGAKSKKRTSESAAVKLTEVVDGRVQFRSDPPLLTRVPDDRREQVIGNLSAVYVDYLQTLPPDRISLLARYSFTDIAHKVVGVGSVGTRALVLLLESGDGEPLLLQAKQANASVLEPYLGESRYRQSGERVVVGQQLMQSGGDPFLGWYTGKDQPIDYYLRQLKDMKGSIEIATLDRDGLFDYARLCGAVLARAHARAGDAARISGYLGGGEAFDAAVGEFAMTYADITDSDHALLVASREALHS